MRDAPSPQLRDLESILLEVFRLAPGFMVVTRGRDHVIELANEAFNQLVGHRDIIGKPLFEAFPEVRGQGFEDLRGAVLDTGVPFVGRERVVSLARTLGAPLEERFVDFVYLPMVDADGTRSGVMTHGSDVTEHVLARRKVERLLGESEATREELAAANDLLQEQQIELEITNQQLLDNAVELEAQTEELAATAAQLE